MRSTEPGSTAGMHRPLTRLALAWVARTWAVLTWVVLTGVALLVYPLLWNGAPWETSDSRSYYDVARDLEDFRFDRLHLRPPGYPILLRFLGIVDGRAAGRLIVAGILLHMAGVALLTWMLADLGLGPRALGAFMAILALPPFVQSAAVVLSENLAQFLLVAAVAATFFGLRRASPTALLCAGLTIGAAALTKPTYQLLAPALALALTALTVLAPGPRLGRRTALLAGSLLVAGSALPISAWVLHNGLRFERFTSSPGNLAYSLSTKTVKVLERLPDEDAAVREALIAARDAQLIERGSSHTAEQYYPEARPAVTAATGVRGRELDDLMLRVHLQLIRRAPLHYLEHVGQSVVRFWMPHVTAAATGGSRAWQFLWSAAHLFLLAVVLLEVVVLGGAALLALSRRQRGGPPVALTDELDSARCLALVLVASVVVYTMAVSCLVHHGEARFRSVTDPLLVLFAVLGAAVWRRLAKGPAGK